MGTVNANVTQRVGDGARRYIFANEGQGGGDLAIWADSAAEANAMIRFIRGLNGAPTTAPGEIIANPNMDPWAPPPAPAEESYEDVYYDDGGYGSGSGGGGGRARPPYNVNADPGYQAFLAAMGITEDSARRAATNRSAEIDEQLQSALPRIGEEGVEARRRIGEGYATRGVFRSGARLRDVALQQRAEGRAVTDATAAAARQKAQLNDTLQERIAQLARERSEKALELTAAHSY